MSLAKIAFHNGYLESSVSARTTDLRKNGIVVEKRKASDEKLFEYRSRQA
ncbi:MAG: hypothetical protein ACJ8C4_07205 [Gemmataceae bacterium]